MAKQIKKKEAEIENAQIETLPEIRTTDTIGSINEIRSDLLSIEHGDHAIDTAVLDAMKLIERLESLVKFIEKALAEK